MSLRLADRAGCQCPLFTCAARRRRSASQPLGHGTPWVNVCFAAHNRFRKTTWMGRELPERQAGVASGFPCRCHTFPWGSRHVHQTKMARLPKRKVSVLPCLHAIPEFSVVIEGGGDHGERASRVAKVAQHQMECMSIACEHDTDHGPARSYSRFVHCSFTISRLVRTRRAFRQFRPHRVIRPPALRRRVAKSDQSTLALPSHKSHEPRSQCCPIDLPLSDVPKWRGQAHAACLSQIPCLQLRSAIVSHSEPAAL